MPNHVLVEVDHGERCEQAAEQVGEITVAEMSMSYPELVESFEPPPLPFRLAI